MESSGDVSCVYNCNGLSEHLVSEFVALFLIMVGLVFYFSGAFLAYAYFQWG